MDRDMERTALRRQAESGEAKEHQEAGRGKEEFSQGALERKRGPADTLISNFWPPELGKNKFP